MATIFSSAEALLSNLLVFAGTGELLKQPVVSETSQHKMESELAAPSSYQSFLFWYACFMERVASVYRMAAGRFVVG